MIRPAATVLLLRDRPEGARDRGGWEVFMVRRSKRSGFMADAMVFPGGRVDDADAHDALVARCDLDRARAAAILGMEDGTAALAFLVAAARETFEEAGVLLADGADAHSEALDAWRDKLNAHGATMLEVLEDVDLHLSLDALVNFAWWLTPEVEPKRYDTRFLAVRMPEGQRPLHEGHETTDSDWLSPAEALDAYGSGQIQLPPPTLRILTDLQPLPDVEAVLRYRADDPPVQIMPRLRMVDGAFHLLLPGDAGFDLDADPEGGPRNRIYLEDGRFHSVGRGF